MAEVYTINGNEIKEGCKVTLINTTKNGSKRLKGNTDVVVIKVEQCKGVCARRSLCTTMGLALYTETEDGVEPLCDCVVKGLTSRESLKFKGIDKQFIFINDYAERLVL